MPASTFADVAFQLQNYYRKPAVLEVLAYGQDPFLAMLKSKQYKPAIGGAAYVTPLQIDDGGNPSNVIGTSGYAAPDVGIQLSVPPAQLTHLMSLTGLAAAGGASGAATYGKPLKNKLDSTFRKLGKIASLELWRDGYPDLGTVVSVGGSTTLTMGDADQIVGISKGDILVFAATRNSGALRAGELTVTAVHQSLGTCTVNANVNSVATEGDTIFLKGTRQTDAAMIAIAGVPGWSAGGASWMGVNTTIDDRASFLKVTGSAADIEGAFISGIRTIMQFADASADRVAFCHPSVWETLAKSLQSRTVVGAYSVKPASRQGREGQVSFSGVEISTPSGSIELYTSRFCLKGHIYLMDISSFELVSWGNGTFPGLVAASLGAGPGILMDPLTGQINANCGGFLNLVCVRPGANIDITLS